jgi:manganese oxidase
VIGMDSNFHDFHIHGHRWKDAAGAFVDTPSLGPNETITARFVEDNPGRWLYHAPDPHARGACDHGRQPSGRGR